MVIIVIWVIIDHTETAIECSMHKLGLLVSQGKHKPALLYEIFVIWLVEHL